MNAVARVVIVGQVESRERKKVGDKNLAEFRVAGVGLKLSAWQDLAVKVPEKGLVLVEGRRTPAATSTRARTERARRSWFRASNCWMRAAQTMCLGSSCGVF